MNTSGHENGHNQPPQAAERTSINSGDPENDSRVQLLGSEVVVEVEDGKGRGTLGDMKMADCDNPFSPNEPGDDRNTNRSLTTVLKWLVLFIFAATACYLIQHYS